MFVKQITVGQGFISYIAPTGYPEFTYKNYADGRCLSCYAIYQTLEYVAFNITGRLYYRYFL